jgi:3D (Asp-Asp-Asp) domain-containing protein
VRLCCLIAVGLCATVPVDAAERTKAKPMQATAYCQAGTTATGATTRRGIVAADPRVLPAGTVIRIDTPLRRYAGTYRVEDTGAAVKGRVVDIFVPDCAAAKRFGRRRVMVHVIKRGAEAQVAAAKD